MVIPLYAAGEKASLPKKNRAAGGSGLGCLEGGVLGSGVDDT